MPQQIAFQPHSMQMRPSYNHIDSNNSNFGYGHLGYPQAYPSSLPNFQYQHFLLLILFNCTQLNLIELILNKVETDFPCFQVYTNTLWKITARLTTVILPTLKCLFLTISIKVSLTLTENTSIFLFSYIVFNIILYNKIHS